MKIYKAIDKLDMKPSYFAFSDDFKFYSVISESEAESEQQAIAYLERTGAKWWNYPYDDRRKDMIDPVEVTS